MKNITPEIKKQVRKEVEKFLTDELQFLYNLKSRWLDEREYEDFNEYVKVIQNRFAKYNNIKLVDINKHFKLTLESMHSIITLKCNKTGYDCQIQWV